MWYIEVISYDEKYAACGRHLTFSFWIVCLYNAYIYVYIVELMLILQLYLHNI